MSVSQKIRFYDDFFYFYKEVYFLFTIVLFSLLQPLCCRSTYILHRNTKDTTIVLFSIQQHADYLFLYLDNTLQTYLIIWCSDKYSRSVDVTLHIITNYPSNYWSIIRYIILVSYLFISFGIVHRLGYAATNFYSCKDYTILKDR